MQMIRISVAVAGVLLAAPSWSQSYRVQNMIQGEYRIDTTVSSPLFGLDTFGNPVTTYGNNYLGSAYNSNSGNSAGLLPAPISFSNIWAGSSGIGATDVTANAYAWSEFGKNHASVDTSGYTQVSGTNTSYYNYTVDPVTGSLVPDTASYITVDSNSSLSVWSQSRWEELYMIKPRRKADLGTTANFNTSFHIDGTLGPATGPGGDGSGNAQVYWSLSTFLGQTVVAFSAQYDAASNIWNRQTFDGSTGLWTYDSGSGALVLGNTYSLTGGYSFTYGDPLYLNSFLQTYLSGNGVSAFGNTVTMTSFSLPEGTSVYAMSGTAPTAYGVSFAGVGGTVCDTIDCVPSGGIGYGTGGGIPPIPEPETYAMLLAGMGLIGFVARRRRAAARA